MSFTIILKGDKEAIKALEEIARKADSSAWDNPLRGIGTGATRYAASISPVVTGSYKGAHRFAVNGKELTLFIDPSAKNGRTGVAVTSYAGDVERRHSVYGQVSAQIGRLAAQWPDEMARELGV